MTTSPPQRSVDDIQKSPATSKVQTFLRKARGQVDRPDDKRFTYTSKETALGSASGSDVVPSEDGHDETYASGGSSRFYEPIATYEGRHRWDPTAEWSEKEEKLLVRRVCLE